MPLHHGSSRRFDVVEPPRTHSKLPCRPDSPSSKVVRGGSALSNHPELTRNCPVGLIPHISQWFEEVLRQGCGRTTPFSPCAAGKGGKRPTGQFRGGSLWSNHPKPYPVGLLPPASQRFGVVEPPRTHSKLPCRSASQ